MFASRHLPASEFLEMSHRKELAIDIEVIDTKSKSPESENINQHLGFQASAMRERPYRLWLLRH